MAFWNDKKIESLEKKHTPIKKFWLHEDVFKSTYFDAGSVLIPVAEEYIVNLLTRISDQIHDESMKKEKELLVEEESAHALVHNSYNKMLEHEGYHISHYQKSIHRLHEFIDRKLSLNARLAFCTAVEHLTASQAILGLTTNIMDSGIDERMRKVWIWHFLEETDHRSNMFDIYKYFGGGYFLRNIMMLWAACLFLLFSFRVRAGLLFQSGNSFNFKIRRDGLRFLWGKNGFHKYLVVSVLRYFRPGFHPSKVKYNESLKSQIHRYPIEKELEAYFPVV